MVIRSGRMTGFTNKTPAVPITTATAKTPRCPLDRRGAAAPMTISTSKTVCAQRGVASCHWGHVTMKCPMNLEIRFPSLRGSDPYILIGEQGVESRLHQHRCVQE